VAYPLTGPFVCRCLTSPILPRFHTPLIEPDRRFSRIRLSEKSSRGRPREAASPRCEADQTQLIMQGRIRIPPLPRHYPASSVLRASPPPQTARPVSHELPLDPTPITAGASRVASDPLCLHAVANTPAGPMRTVRSSSPSTAAFPRFTAGQLLHHPFRGLHSVHYVTAYKLAKSPKRPSTPEASAASLPLLLLRLLPGGANQFPGGLFPLSTSAFSRRTQNSRLEAAKKPNLSATLKSSACAATHPIEASLERSYDCGAARVIAAGVVSR
jgi:hypothetical protein